MKKSKNEGIHALNQEFSKYDQVEKKQSYRLAEDEAQDEFDDEYEIQVCDMNQYFSGKEAGRIAFANQLGAALEGIGFAILVNHGVPPELYSTAREKVQELFTSTTRDERMRYLASRHGSVNQGYFPMKETTRIHPDLVEGWVFCRRAFNFAEDNDWKEETYWPRPGYEPVFRDVCQANEQLFLPIMRSILTYLGCDPALYDDKLRETNFGFRLNYYPPIDAEDAKSGAGRMLGHEDVDLFTILPAERVDGLQVLNRENMKWIRLTPPPDSIILNTGDYMQRITNDRLPSTTHRVSKPRSAELLGTPRITIPMAVYVWEDEILEVLPGLGEPHYEPISAVRFHTSITSKYYGDEYAENVDDEEGPG